ncbi:hypothetical protein W97_07079 [Coniosporium apollinis CBS 100218]|uniref:Uncharacterized protein n=1 Tax=Coniosporium apollinis (strain CBS 100218) TaxID=1168221 RepID=R7Z1A7_CONA1|nr:uncharacterized protein W97_07079 [Coniosporium apollinis CBS 100218]EON67824.1 hypothetical protein W97_07079 [Coniosporium apollinis CBS 100218]
MKFMEWGHERVIEVDGEDGEYDEYVKVEREGEDEDGRWTMGEKPDDLALVIEKGEAEFEIGYAVGPLNIRTKICEQFDQP